MSSKVREEVDSYCGLCCANCEFKDTNNCGGCIATKGNPFHGDSCEVAACAQKRGTGFCGECPDFPCEIITRYTNDEEHGDAPKGARIERCKDLKTRLVAEAREGIEIVACCGFHCDHCFLGQWCGGCRSNYNCCSFATICEGNVCGNVKCATEKNLNGCYECDELDNCKKGFYGNKDEILAKGSALFIRKYDVDTYKKAIKKAIEAGADYPKAFELEGSAEGVVKEFEKYI